MNAQRRLAIGCLALALVFIAGGVLDRPAAQTKPKDAFPGVVRSRAHT